ncbi:hypothetical protein TNCV_1344361 [Trichonephila clavipes]|nr:hypothetical protein TNCV_1344361 [Trichonephila clavipes]
MLRRLVGTTAPGHHDCSIQEGKRRGSFVLMNKISRQARTSTQGRLKAWTNWALGLGHNGGLVSFLTQP